MVEISRILTMYMIIFNNLNYYFLSNVIIKLNGKSMLWNKSYDRKA